MAELAVYFDDSGTHDESEIVVAAGYVSTVDLWADFSRAWQKLLADETTLPVNPFGLRVFHMTDFENSGTDPSSAFYGWTRDQKGAFMAKATATINAVAGPGRGAGIVMGVLPETFGKMLEFEPPMRSYTFALLEAMKCVERWADENNHNDPILYYFDAVPRHRGETLRLVRDVERELDLTQRFRFADWGWSSKDKHSELQAADVLAYESWKEGNHSGVLGRTMKAIPVRKSLRALAPFIRYHTMFDDLGLRQWISALDDAEWLEERRRAGREQGGSE